jgi:acyl-CoA thioesterase-1
MSKVPGSIVREVAFACWGGARIATSRTIKPGTWLLLLMACGCSEERVPALPGEGESAVARVEGGAERAAVGVPADAPLVAFLGDSIAAGLHLAEDEAFPAVLQRQLAAEGLPFRLVNAGVSGDTTAGGLRRVEWVLKQRPAVLVVELGANDGMRGLEPADVERNLRGIVERARAAGARVVLLGMDVHASLGADYTASFSAVYPRLADELGLALVPRFLDGVGGEPAMTLEDGLHPTRAGHERLAANVAPVLRKELAALRAEQRSGD